MTPQAFVDKWCDMALKERSASQSHFNDLCRLLGKPSPTDADKTGEWYTFERGADKSTGRAGWADVWKKGCCRVLGGGAWAGGTGGVIAGGGRALTGTQAVSASTSVGPKGSDSVPSRFAVALRLF